MTHLCKRFFFFPLTLEKIKKKKKRIFTCSIVSSSASQSLQRSSRDLSRLMFSRSAARDFRLRPLLTVACLVMETNANIHVSCKEDLLSQYVQL